MCQVDAVFIPNIFLIFSFFVTFFFFRTSSARAGGGGALPDFFFFFFCSLFPVEQTTSGIGHRVK